MPTHYHCCITLDGAIKNWKFLTINNRPATLKDVKEAVDEAKMKGYTVLPPCDNVDERGHCKGHLIEGE